MAISCTILLNRLAGQLHGGIRPEQITQTAEEIGLPVDIITTNSGRDMRNVLRRLVAENAKRVGVVGGDGTVSAAAQELACSKTALGIIPQGTFNNFANALHLPSDLTSAMRVLKDGVVRDVDLGKVRDRYFTEAAGVGLFADALALYGAGPSKNLIRAAHTLTRILFSYHAYRIRLIVDGEPLVEQAVLCTVANTFRTGAALPIAPDAKVTDGRLDVVVIGDLKRRELLPYFRAVLAKRHTSLPQVTSRRAREVRIESRRKMRVHCDDQIIGTTPVTIDTEPKALKVLVERL